MKLGLDIGGVLIPRSRSASASDTSFMGSGLRDVLLTPPYPGMFEVVPLLVTRFDGQVWLVSKAHRRMQDKTRRWLDHHRFFERTQIPADHIRFCLERPQKADLCREIGITHFLDDRLDVLQHLKDVVPNRYLFAPEERVKRDASIVAISNWPAASLRIVP